MGKVPSISHYAMENTHASLMDAAYCTEGAERQAQLLLNRGSLAWQGPNTLMGLALPKAMMVIFRSALDSG